MVQCITSSKSVLHLKDFFKSENPITLIFAECMFTRICGRLNKTADILFDIDWWTFSVTFSRMPMGGGEAGERKDPFYKHGMNISYGHSL